MKQNHRAPTRAPPVGLGLGSRVSLTSQYMGLILIRGDDIILQF